MTTVAQKLRRRADEFFGEEDRFEGNRLYEAIVLKAREMLWQARRSFEVRLALAGLAQTSRAGDGAGAHGRPASIQSAIYAGYASGQNVNGF